MKNPGAELLLKNHFECKKDNHEVTESSKGHVHFMDGAQGLEEFLRSYE